MNRRQFLTGVSAAAVASALPAPPAMQAWGERITADDLAFALWNQRINAAYAITARAIAANIFAERADPFAAFFTKSEPTLSNEAEFHRYFLPNNGP